MKSSASYLWLWQVVTSLAVTTFSCALFASPFFTSSPQQAPLELTLKTDFDFAEYHGKSRNRTEELPKFPGVIEYQDGSKKYSQSIEISARGSGRLNHCRFAPFKISLKKKDRTPLFAEVKGKNLKVVSHCLPDGSTIEESNMHILKEALLYKMLTALNIPSFEIRLLKIHYQTVAGVPLTSAFAFAIEDKESLIQRDPRLVSEREDFANFQMEKLKQKFGDDVLEQVQAGKLSTTEVTEFMNRLAEIAINVDRHVSAVIAQLLILNDDWGGTLSSGNAVSFDDNEGRITRVHYDFDLSALVHKFSGRKSRYGMTFPATVESDVAWLRQFCSKTWENVLSPEVMTDGCRQSLPKILQQKEKVLSAIQDFPVLTPEEKAEISQRAEVFFKAVQDTQRID